MGALPLAPATLAAQRFSAQTSATRASVPYWLCGIVTSWLGMSTALCATVPMHLTA